ncbi:hypothetical protein [Mangrovicella endophytica]|uniref:hypothetical protein n=1 Tax=Mangrovicella endophytica TaxID=2066697 RepID=UPI000C9DFA80|nr:hypothetical protein [Mangrovicella endophytica]
MTEESDAPTVPPRNRGSSIGHVIDVLRHQQIRVYSGLERDVAMVLVTSPGVVRVEEQVRFSYLDEDGLKRTHIFDFVVTLADGRRSAIAVKYVRDVEKTGLRQVIALCARQTLARCAHDPRNVPFADEFRIMTERHVDGITVGNARLVLACARIADQEGQEAVSQWLQSAPEHFRIGEACAAIGPELRGYHAAVALVPSGAVVIPSGHRIDPDLEVRNGLSRAR